MRKARRGLTAATLVGALGLTGCGGSSRPSSTSTAAPTQPAVASSPTATPAPAILGQIVWSQSVDPVTSAPIGKASSIGPNAAAIYAVIPVKNVGSGWVVSASWTFNGDALNDVGSSLTAANAIGEGWIEFHLTLAADQTWPVGTLAVAVRQAGGNSVHASLKISRPTG